MKKEVLLIFLMLCCCLQSPIIEADAQAVYTIAFDLSHGQYSSYVHDFEDANLAGNLTEMGHTVLWATGGINDSILAVADALIIGSMYGDTPFSPIEINSISDWFDSGDKLLWVCGDSDYDGTYINANASALLSSVGSHVYPEPTYVNDDVSNCGASYRPVATVTSADSFVTDIVANVQGILMHGPTCVYGSTTGDGANAVDLRSTTITNVYPILYYSPDAIIVDSDLVLPLAHSNGEQGSFVAMTVETNAGATGNGVIIVSGASPYGDYKPMYADNYHDVELDGHHLIPQAIIFGLEHAIETTSTTQTTAATGTTTAVTYSPTPGLDMRFLIIGGSLGLIGVVMSAGVYLSRKRKSTTDVILKTTDHGPMKRAPVLENNRVVETLRGCEVVGGQFHYKVKVKNSTDYVITNVTVNLLAYPKDCMVLEGTQMKSISRIEPDAFRSPSFILSPTADCVEGQIVAVVSFMDYQNKAYTIEVEPYTIRSVCDLLKPLESTVEQFDIALSGMECTSERFESDQNASYLFTKTKTLLPEKNFSIIEASAKTIGGEFSGTIRGFAQGKYTGQKVAVQILISGAIEGTKSVTIIEGLGDDLAMVPTALHELSQGIKTWICKNCGGALELEQVAKIRQSVPIECKYCKQTLTIEQYRE